MWIKDFILRQLGIGSVDNILDSICDNFDVEITSEDVKTAMMINYNEELEEPISAQYYLISLLYNRIIENAVENYGLDNNKFSQHINANDSKLWYDGKQLYCSKDIEEIASNTKEVE